jgi:hypothetical protein
MSGGNDDDIKPDGASDDEAPVDSAEDEGVRRLLRRAMPEPVRPPSPEFLRGVQARIRTRSRGKFFADGWSTSNRRVGYGTIAVAMLILLLLVFVLMTPRSFTP